MGKKMNAVVIGCGAVGPVHAEAIEGCGDAALYGACDTIAERARSIADKFGCRAFDSFDEVLADTAVDSVHICTPHYLHDEMLVKAARAGKHVVIEKPFSIDAARAEAAAEELNQYPVKVCPVLQNRFTPCMEAAKQMIRQGKYGDVTCARGVMMWQRTAEYYRSEAWRGKWETEGGGLLINQAVHLLDMMTDLAGRASSVKGTIDNRTLAEVIEVEDTAEATYFTPDGKRLFFYATNGYACNTPFDLEVQLEKAALKLTYDKLYLVEDGVFSLIAENAGKVPGKSYWGGGHYKLISQFYAALAGKPEVYPAVEDGVYAVKLVSALYESAKSGMAVEF